MVRAYYTVFVRKSPQKGSGNKQRRSHALQMSQAQIPLHQELPDAEFSRVNTRGKSLFPTNLLMRDDYYRLPS